MCTPGKSYRLPMAALNSGAVCRYYSFSDWYLPFGVEWVRRGLVVSESGCWKAAPSSYLGLSAEETVPHGPPPPPNTGRIYNEETLQ